MKCCMLLELKVMAMGHLAWMEKVVLLESCWLVETKWEVAELLDWMDSVVFV